VKNLIIAIGFLLISCNTNINKSVDEIWKEGQQHRIANNLKEAISSFKSIINNFPKHELSAKAQFQIADIFLNDEKNYDYAIKEIKLVVKNYPNHDDAKKSLFMIAYIYNNYINAYSDAILHYHLFKEKYPNDELIPSVEYELNGLKNVQSTIDSLNLEVKKNIGIR